MIDGFFKNYFWTFILGVLFVGAFLLAQTANAFVARWVRVPPEQRLAAMAAQGSGGTENKRAAVTMSSFLERNLLGAMREDLAAIEAEKQRQADLEKGSAEKDEAPGNFDTNSCQKSRVSEKLVAVFYSTIPEESAVAFFDESDKTARLIRINEDVDKNGEVKLRRVGIRTAYLEKDGRCEYVSLDDDDKKPRPKVAQVKEEKEEDDELGKNVQKTGDGEYTIAKEEIDNVLSNLNKLATQARIVPSFKDGKANGFKLFSIRPNSLYAKIGIKNGDVVQQINGYELNSPDKALEIYSKLKDASSISVDLLRRGKAKSLSYTIR
ncbi:MAG: type II secretion system protein GspC [Myxococcota bacterium]